jgi:hypothetical protein
MLLKVYEVDFRPNCYGLKEWSNEIFHLVILQSGPMVFVKFFVFYFSEAVSFSVLLW